jgi:hypothetical protein
MNPDGLMTATPGLTHSKVLVWLDQTGLPAWQIGVTSFFVLSVIGILVLVASSYPDPGMYSNVVAFNAIVNYLLVFYLELGRGWHKDFQRMLEFDQSLYDVSRIMTPSKGILMAEILLAIVSAFVNLQLNNLSERGYALFTSLGMLMLFLQYILAIFIVDLFSRQLLMLNRIVKEIRLDLLNTEFYSSLADTMFRFLRLYIFGLCIVAISFNIFDAESGGFNQLLISMMPFYLPGLLMMGLFLIPFNGFKSRMRLVKSIELNHVLRAMAGDKAHLKASLIGADADKLSMVDLMYYEDRIRKIKEWPFTDRIRSLLLFGVLPPLTWVIAALIEIFIEGVL